MRVQEHAIFFCLGFPEELYVSETVVVGFGFSLLAIPLVQFCFLFSVNRPLKVSLPLRKATSKIPIAKFYSGASSNKRENRFPDSRESKIRDVSLRHIC